jgi:hypothetical protein
MTAIGELRVAAKLEKITFVSDEPAEWSITSKRAAVFGPRRMGFGRRGVGENPFRGETPIGAGTRRKGADRKLVL